MILHDLRSIYLLCMHNNFLALPFAVIETFCSLNEASFVFSEKYIKEINSPEASVRMSRLKHK